MQAVALRCVPGTALHGDPGIALHGDAGIALCGELGTALHGELGIALCGACRNPTKRQPQSQQKRGNSIFKKNESLRLISGLTLHRGTAYPPPHVEGWSSDVPPTLAFKFDVVLHRQLFIIDCCRLIDVC
tara:strand:- start:248 stop:637 length:390 start_codon:yes stop_codon:yes gene_type:complete